MLADNPASLIRLKGFLLIAIGLLVAVVFGWLVGTADYFSLLLGALILVGGTFWFASGRFFWVVAVASSYLNGTFPILGGSFNTFQILLAIGVFKFFVEDLIMMRAKLRSSRLDLILIAGFMTIITVHGLHDRFGMKFLGSTIWGGRNYVNVYVGLLAFFIIQSIPIRGRIWDKLPYVVLAVTSFDLLIGIITAAFPSTISKIYPFYSAVSLSGATELLTGREEITGRIGTFGSFGCTLIVIVLSRVSLPRLFNPRNLWRVATTAVGGVCVLLSGFRSDVGYAFLSVMVAGVRDLRFKVVALVPVFVALLFGISFVNSSIVELPKQVQRALTFMPGHWDNEMMRNAEDSNEFRRNVWGTFLHDYFPLHPWLGRGFGFRSEYATLSTDIAYERDFTQWVEVGNIHSGFLASLDALGIIGTIFFIIWNIGLLIQTVRVSFAEQGEGSFALRFVAIELSVAILSYWIGVVTVGTYLPQIFALSGVFLNLQRRKADQLEPASSDSSPLLTPHLVGASDL